MTTPAFPNSFVSGTTIFATAINSNWTTWVNMLTDGTYSYSVGNLSVTTMTVSGNAQLGSSSADNLTVNAAINTHLVASGVSAGNSSFPFGNAYVDYGTSHAGTVYFNGGTQYMQATSGATNLNHAGFTYLDFNSGSVTGVNTAIVSDFTIPSDFTLSGLIKGKRSVYQANGTNNFTNATSGLTMKFLETGLLNNAVDAEVYAQSQYSGSIAGISYNFYGDTVTTSAPALNLRVYKNSSLFLTVATFAISTGGQEVTGVVSYPKNSYPISGGDKFAFILGNYSTGIFGIIYNVSMEIYEE